METMGAIDPAPRAPQLPVLGTRLKWLLLLPILQDESL